ncbi:MAG: hypothetical protein MJA29_03495 [Candidatus Omnitrophica bacterium]|nr:hypothetical protein [Candidatus Omnitrophota bacterium]
MVRIRKRAQSVAEYAIAIASVIAALVAISLYVQRGMQGVIKDGVDTTAETLNITAQYEPYYYLSDHATTSDSSRSVSESAGSAWTRTIEEDSRAVEGVQENLAPIDE